MKIRESKMEIRGWKTRSVRECGSPLPLFNGGKWLAQFQSARGLAQSKTFRFRSVLALFCVILLFSVSGVHAQPYSIDTYKIAGGGGTSSGGNYSVTGTIGQPEAGAAMSGGNYSVTGGFWSLISVVPTPGAPTLTITHSGNSVKISWPYPSTGWTLQQNSDLSTANWTTSGGIANDGTNNFITITSPSGNVFFRLGQ
jgi:hypothetical protein